jgi:DNA-binding Xre family transcriptional regulator
MLYFDFKAVFKARNITNPYGWMQSNGFSRRTAYNIAHTEMQVLKLEHLYKLCKLLNCTPNDMIRYTAEKESLSETHPLQKIKGPALTATANELLKTLSLEELNAFAGLLKEKKAAQ